MTVTTLKATDFGVVADGTTDDTAALNDAIAHALASEAELLLPAGDIAVTTLATIGGGGNIIIRGQGSTRLLTTVATGDVITIGDGTNQVGNVHLRDFRIWSTVTRTSGAAIKLNRAARCTLVNIKTGSAEDYYSTSPEVRRLYDGVWFNGIASNVYRDCQSWGCSRDALIINGDAGWAAEIVIDGHTLISECGRNGILIGGSAGGVYLVSGGVQKCTTGVRVDTSITETNNREVFSYTGFAVDSNSENGYLFGPESCSIFNATGGWSAGNGNVGLLVEPGQLVGAKWVLNGFVANANKSHGIYHRSQEMFLSNCQVTNNGHLTGGAGTHGLVTGDSSSSTAPTIFSMVGSYVGGNGGGGSGYGVVIQAYLPVYSIQTNIIRGNSQGEILNLAGTSATQVVANNVT